ncbi:hypothetical protein [Acinetobacter seifertii]|nr:hypothetical protein [Acinetobacter seifertii]
MLLRNDALNMISRYEVDQMVDSGKLNILIDYWFIFEDENIKINDDLKKFLK